MTSTTVAPDSLEAKCPGGLGWAFYGLGECIRTSRDKISIAFGVLSILSWLLFALPQMITNCIKKIPDEAVSPLLLIFWLIGDSLNFIGAFLTHQLFLQTKEKKIGYAIGWIGTFMYFCSRAPQIFQNFKRKSTEGLSPYLFLLAILGNVFYGLQIFIKSTDATFILTALPWILGSLGILVFDVIVSKDYH
ncbi:unnamed protein product [Dibothriocephalus latus]|uniref:Uncharacterized protein n=1 Tax=Dibothriocephalus latus TaxID=60516 RepID=A0A3P6U266_DIBLA|nr:unnamed protein product [Dibothriocephalus latus]